MMSNKGLNSNEALDESTATNSSVTLSGIRREKEAVIALDIKDYTPDPALNHGLHGSGGSKQRVSKVGDTYLPPTQCSDAAGTDLNGSNKAVPNHLRYPRHPWF